MFVHSSDRRAEVPAMEWTVGKSGRTIELGAVDKIAMGAIVWRAVELSKFWDDVQTLPTSSQRLGLLPEAGSLRLWYVMRTEQVPGRPVEGCQPSTYPTGLTVELEATGGLRVSCSQGFAGRDADSELFDPYVLAAGPLA